MPSDIKTQLIVFRSFAVVICLVCTGAIATNSDKPLRTFTLRGPQTTGCPPSGGEPPLQKPRPQTQLPEPREYAAAIADGHRDN